MKCNVGNMDRAFRMFIGLLLVGWGVYLTKNWLVLLGAVLVLSGAFRFCALYCLLKNPLKNVVVANTHATLKTKET